MWPFASGAPRDAPKIAELEERVRKLERLELEWLEWYDKFRRLYARIAKRTEELHKLEKPLEDAPGATNGDEPVPQHPPTRARVHILRGF